MPQIVKIGNTYVIQLGDNAHGVDKLVLDEDIPEHLEIIEAWELMGA